RGKWAKRGGEGPRGEQRERLKRGGRPSRTGVQIAAAAARNPRPGWPIQQPVPATGVAIERGLCNLPLSFGQVPACKAEDLPGPSPRQPVGWPLAPPLLGPASTKEDVDDRLVLSLARRLRRYLPDRASRPRASGDPSRGAKRPRWEREP